MPFRHHIESIRWIRGEDQMLLVRGWVIALRDHEIVSVRLDAGAVSQTGCHGLPRPDVARAFPTESEAAFSGFSVLARMQPSVREVTLMALDSAGSGNPIATILLDERVEAADFWLTETERAPAPRAPGSPAPILFIGHDFACAGAQLILLRQLRWLKARTELAFELLLAVPRSAVQHAGPNERRLLDDLAALCPVHFISDTTGAAENVGSIQARRYRLIYANTATLGWLLPSFRPLHCPVVSHIHELGFWIERRTGLHVFGRQRQLTSRFIACSGAVADYLRERANISSDRIEIIHECGSIAAATAAQHLHDRAAVRTELGLDDDTFAIVACGTFDWRKGAELFLPICIALRRLLGGAKRFRAYWIGSYGGDLVRDQFEHEARVAGLEGVVQLLGHRPDPLKLMLAADCFALPSREDPFPLVMLEAATLGLPVVGFRDSGGVVEFVGEDAGLLANYLDLEGFATALCRLALNPEEARHRGEAARHKASSSFDEEISFRRIHTLIETLVHPPALS